MSYPPAGGYPAQNTGYPQQQQQQQPYPGMQPNVGYGGMGQGGVQHYLFLKFNIF